MIITRSFLVQMVSMRAQINDIGDGFQIMCMHFYEFFANFLFTAKSHFSGGKMLVKYVIF